MISCKKSKESPGKQQLKYGLGNARNQKRRKQCGLLLLRERRQWNSFGAEEVASCPSSAAEMQLVNFDDNSFEEGTDLTARRGKEAGTSHEGGAHLSHSA